MLFILLKLFNFSLMKISTIYLLLKIVGEAFSAYLTYRLTKLSKKDPFKNNFIGNISNYFYNYPEDNILAEGGCICDNITLNYSCTEEDLLSGCKNITFEREYYRYFYLRRLGSLSFCSDIYQSFERNQGKKISYVFDLNYKSIRKFSLPLNIINIIFILLFLLLFLNDNCNITTYNFGSLSVFFFAAWVVKVILSILVYHYMEKGDIEKYNDFLKCSQSKKSFFTNLTDIENLRKIFDYFIYVNFASEIIDKIKDSYDLFIKNKDNPDAKTV